jgi:hypothetical protein
MLMFAPSKFSSAPRTPRKGGLTSRDNSSRPLYSPRLHSSGDTQYKGEAPWRFVIQRAGSSTLSFVRAPWNKKAPPTPRSGVSVPSPRIVTPRDSLHRDSPIHGCTHRWTDSLRRNCAIFHSKSSLGNLNCPRPTAQCGWTTAQQRAFDEAG